jgi:MFS family permease
MTAPTTERTALGRRSAAVAVTTLFALNGALIGGMVGTLPAMRDRLGVEASGISVLLFCLAGSAVISMQIGGRLADSLGARKVALVTPPTLTAGVLVLSFAQSLPVAIVGGVLGGLGNGAMDVAMNALGVQVEQARPRPIMSFFHAFWSVGNLAGAGVIVVVARLLDRSGADVIQPALLVIAALALAAYAAIFRIVPRAARIEHHENGVRIKLPTLAWLLGAMAFGFGLTEGTAIDWSSIHVTDVAGIDPARGALGLVAVSGFMVLIRLCGDRAVVAFGRQRVVQFGGTVALIGYVVVVTTHPLPLLLVGWSLVGLGVGMIAPQVYAVAGHVGGGRMLAVVVTFGYAAFLVGPAIVGTLVSWLGVQHAMILPLVLCGGLVALSRVMPKQ